MLLLRFDYSGYNTHFSKLTLHSVDLAFPKSNEHVICRRYLLLLLSKFAVVSSVCIKQQSNCC